MLGKLTALDLVAGQPNCGPAWAQLRRCMASIPRAHLGFTSRSGRADEAPSDEFFMVHQRLGPHCDGWRVDLPTRAGRGR